MDLCFLIEIFNPIYTCGLWGIVVLSVMVSQEYGFYLLFEIDNGKLTKFQIYVWHGYLTIQVHLIFKTGTYRALKIKTL
jgi:hypothetical protein